MEASSRLLLMAKPFTLSPGTFGAFHRNGQRRLGMASVLKKRRKKMRKHKHKKLRRRQKFLRRKN